MIVHITELKHSDFTRDVYPTKVVRVSKVIEYTFFFYMIGYEWLFKSWIFIRFGTCRIF